MWPMSIDSALNRCPFGRLTEYRFIDVGSVFHPFIHLSVWPGPNLTQTAIKREHNTCHFIFALLTSLTYVSLCRGWEGVGWGVGGRGRGSKERNTIRYVPLRKHIYQSTITLLCMSQILDIAYFCDCVDVTKAYVCLWYALGFVFLCVLLIRQWFLLDTRDTFTDIHQGHFPGYGAIIQLSKCQQSDPEDHGCI